MVGWDVINNEAKKEIGGSCQTARQEVVLGQPCRPKETIPLFSPLPSLCFGSLVSSICSILPLTFFNSFGGRGQGLDLKIKQ